MDDPATHADNLSSVRAELGYSYVRGSHWFLVLQGGLAAS